MPLAPEAADLLRRLEELGMRPYDEIGVLGARHAVDASRWMQGEKPGAVTTRELVVAGGDGRLPARVYHPEPGTEAFPSLRSPGAMSLTVWFHGGGWVAGSVLYADRICRAVATASRTVVVSVEYRRPPETPFPGPVEDAEAATAWLAEHAAEIDADASRLVVAGDSAGGNLAAVVARRLKTRVARQLLIYPPVAPPDPHLPHGEGYLLTARDMAFYWRHYVGDREPHPDAAPLLADDLAGVAPASIAVAGFDPLRDEGVAYAERLRGAGVDVSLREWPDMIHGFLGMAGELPQTAELLAWIGEELR